MPSNLFAQIHRLQRILNDQIDRSVATEIGGMAAVIMPASYLPVHLELNRLIDVVHATARLN